MTARPHRAGAPRTVRRLGAAVLAAACTAATFAAAPTGPASADDDGGPTVPDGAAFALYAPEKATAYRYGRRAYVDLGVRAVAGAEDVVIRSNRASYDDPIETTWTAGALSGSFPSGTQTNFRGLPDFLTLDFRRLDGEVTRTRTSNGCLNGQTERVRPDAAARSIYPRGCPRNVYTQGSVQGIEAGWATNLLGYGRGMRLPKGRYDVTVTVADTYVDAFGLDPDSATQEIRLVVKKPDDGGYWYRQQQAELEAEADGPTARPAPQRPSGKQGGVVAEDGPRPDLQSLPAFDIGLNRKGNLLRFAANVWNAGNSPLVVDGFRGADEDEMDAYQYFFDSDGEQVGYQQVDSHFHWHEANHQHWHFQDFARYRLLDADMEPVRTSGKISFCLANTDAVDYTVPGAEWRPGNTNLSTSCGRLGSLSIREVLSAGSGDTYAQYRAGQALGIKDLPDGVYYLSVEANPFGKLVESDTTNNNAIRRVRIGTNGRGERFVRAAQVGIVEEGPGSFFRPDPLSVH